MRVFVVEDDEFIRKALVRTLRPVFPGIETFADPEEAIAAARGGSPAVVISDYSLPHRDGVDLITELRRTNPLLGTVLLSGTVVDEKIAAALDRGIIDRFVQKPWRHGELTQTVQALLAQAA